MHTFVFNNKMVVKIKMRHFDRSGANIVKFKGKNKILSTIQGPIIKIPTTHMCGT